MSEEGTQKLLYQLQMLETYLADLTQKENSLAHILREATSAIESIKTAKEKPDSEVLFPIGMGTFFKTKIQPTEKLIMNVGSGVAMEKDLNSTINFIESRIKEIEIALRDTLSKKQEVMISLERGKKEINQMMQGSVKQ